MSSATTVLFDRYRVDAVLGEGGQAVVLRVFDLRLGVARALKMLFPKVAKKRSLRERFVAEAQLLARIEHPNVVRVYDVEVRPPAPFFVAELVTGGSLADRLKRGALGPRRVAQIVQQVCDGLSAAHAAGVVHRDVKPHNLLLTPAGQCKLVDFGIAHFEEGGRTKAGVTMGTEGYMPPEQYADAAAVDVRADVYGVGMTAFVLLTRRDPVEWLGGRRKGVPEALVPVLTAATEQDRDRRPPTIEALAVAFREAAASLPPDPPDADLAGVTVDDPALEHRITEVSDWFSRVSETTSEVGAPPTTATSQTAAPATAVPAPSGSLAAAGYTMSRPQRDGSSEAPAYQVVEEPALPRGFEVKLEDEERQSSQDARLRRLSEEASPKESEAQVGTPLDAEPVVAEGARWAGLLPKVIAAAALISVVLTVAVVWLANDQARRERELVVKARTQFVQTVAHDVAVFGALEQLGSDPATLTDLLGAFEHAEDDAERAVVAARIVEHVRLETERLAPPGSAQRIALDQQTAAMVNAAEVWERVAPRP